MESWMSMLARRKAGAWHNLQRFSDAHGFWFRSSRPVAVHGWHSEYTLCDWL